MTGPHDPTPVVIVGAGPAGSTTARMLLKEQRPVVLLSEEATAPYDRTDLSKALLLGQREEPRPLLDAELAQPELDLRLRTSALDVDRAAREVVLDDGERLAYGTLVLASGAAARQLPVPGAELAGVHTIRAVADVEDLLGPLRAGSRTVVIGAGLIGLEVAAAAAQAGGEVTVVEVAGQALGRVLPDDLASSVVDEHRRHGVRFEFDTAVTGFDGADGHVTGVELADGRRLPADLAVVAVGSTPRTELAERAGLSVDDGVLVDDRFRTSDPHVRAVGDVIRLPDGSAGHAPRTEAWTPAMQMGLHLARLLAGDDAPYDQVPWMWSDQYDLKLQAAGVSREGLQQVRRGAFEDPAGHVAFSLDGDRLVHVAAVGRGAGAGRTVRAAMLLISAGRPVDPAALADPAVSLRDLARD